MRRVLAPILLLALAVLPAAARAADRAALDRAELDRLVAAMPADPAHPVSGLAVVAVRDGRVVYEAAAGRAVIDPLDPARERPFTADTRVRVASISKVPVALAALSLAEEGRLDLDRDAGEYLGFALRNPAFPDRPVTVRMLLAHTSSIRDGEVYGLPVQHALSDFFDPAGPFWEGGAHWAAADPAGDRGPGAFFAYANLNLGVLATIVERVAGERFDAVVAARILRPLGIAGAYDVRTLDEAAFATLAPVYRREGRGAWEAQVDDYRGRRPDDLVSPFGVAATAPLSAYQVGRNATVLSPQGGLRASARELAQLVRLLLGEGTVDGVRVLKAETVRAALSPAWSFDPARGNGETERGLYASWGLGLQRAIPVPGSGGRLHGHLGEAYGLLGGIMLDPERRVGFAYLIAGTSATPQEYPGEGSAPSAWEASLSSALWAHLAATP
ncbi:MAG TPA: serine hydrolase domain-containing protein [Azospirillaceae bacterium]|nr:serine hydrolase domain-containing protein [Azospirillaceae bacterium]